MRSKTQASQASGFSDTLAQIDARVEANRRSEDVTRAGISRADKPMMDFEAVFQAVTAHVTRAAEKLRQHRLVAGTLTVFFHTNRYRPDRPQYAGSRTTRIPSMSSDTFELVQAARLCAEAAWPRDKTIEYGFTKAGVMVNDLLPIADRPQTLFDRSDTAPSAAMIALDKINDRFGKKTMVLASEGMKQSWQLRADHRSPRYTTRLSDLPVVR